MAHSVHEVVRQVCLWMPETEEFVSHGSPNFRVRGKSFAAYVINHHGDGRVALWLNSPAGALEHHVDMDPEHYFIPPYAGSRGWLGVMLDRGLAWRQIAHLVREAYEKVAPKAVIAGLAPTPSFRAPTKKLAPGDIDPLQSKRGVAVLATLRKICLALPEANEAVQFGCPVWRAGTKTFVWMRCAEKRLSTYVWVGVERQGIMVEDRRFCIPAYMGHNGWVALDVTDRCDAAELTALALNSYRHFALKRMLDKCHRSEAGVE